MNAKIKIMTEKKVYILAHHNLWIIFCVTLTAIMGVSSIIPVFPSIREAFFISEIRVGWLITAFTLPGIFFAPVFGILADRFGPKVLLVCGLVVFGLSGGACFFVSDFSFLVALRFVQGIGAASLGVLSVILISGLYEGRVRVQAMGYNAAVLALGTTFFPLVGGALGEMGWHYPFLLSFLALPLAGVVHRKLCSRPCAEKIPFLKYLHKVGGQISHRPFPTLFAATAVSFIILYGLFIGFLPSYLRDIFGAGPWEVGVIFAVPSFVTALVSTRLNRLSLFIKPGKLLFVSFLFYALSVILIPLASGLWWIISSMLFFGLAQALNIPVTQSLLTELVSPKEQGVVMGINAMILRTGQSAGPFFIGSAFMLGGYSGTFVFTSLLACIMGIVVLLTFLKQ